MSDDALILTLNAGSSSLKFGLYEAVAEPVAILAGTAELGERAGVSVDGEEGAIALPSGDHATAVEAVLRLAEERAGKRAVRAIGHRIVHGGEHFAEPTPLDAGAIERLRALVPLAPLHQPHNLAGVEAARAAHPEALQVGCFDTAFHRTQPPEEDRYALPGALTDAGVRAYGFHGLSYAFIAGELERVAPAIACGRVVVAHLGNGASMCAMRGGRSLASSMGFSPLDGLVMGTRSGALDPAVPIYLMDRGMSAREIEALLYRRSGLLGVSGLSHDMRTLEAAAAEGHGGAERAITLFAHRAKRMVGSLAAALGGLDALVFTGGIGEHSALVRARICDGLAWMGIALDGNANAAHGPSIGRGGVRVLVVPTDEERVIARAAARALGKVGQ